MEQSLRKRSLAFLSLHLSLRLKVLFTKNKPIFFFFLLNPSAPLSVFLSKGNVVLASFHLHAGGAVGVVFYHRMKIALCTPVTKRTDTA